MAARIVLVDGNALVHRAFHALPLLTSPKGELVNAVFGVASMLLQVLQDLHPEYVAAAFDTLVPTFRHLELDAYKAQRDPVPEGLSEQFARVHEFMDAMGIPAYHVDGFDADDVLGTLTKQARQQGLDVVILTGGTGALQLVAPGVEALTSRRGFTDTVLYGERDVLDQYGIQASGLADLKALKGDTSDNMPGVPGIAEKTASKLISEYGSLEGIYDNLDKLTPRLKQLLESYRDQAFHSRHLSRIVTDAPVSLQLDRCRTGTYDRQRLVELFHELGFKSLVDRLPRDGPEQRPARRSAALCGRREVGDSGGDLSSSADSVAHSLAGTLERLAESADGPTEEKAVASRSASVDHSGRFIDYAPYDRLRLKLLRSYKGKMLEKVFPGECLSTSQGLCYLIPSIHGGVAFQCDPDAAAHGLLSDTKVLPGIADRYQQYLAERGYPTVSHLKNHPRFGPDATSFIELVERHDIDRLQSWLLERHCIPKSHPLHLYPSGLLRPENLVFVDVETLGLQQQPIFLIGIARVDGQRISVWQYLARDIGEEPAILEACRPNLAGEMAIVSFNGRAFDIPYIQQRMGYYNLAHQLRAPHFDLRHFSKRAWGGDLPNGRLRTIEQLVLGLEREDDVPSMMVPGFYRSYLEKKNVGPLVPIIEHNRQDLVSLARILTALLEKWKQP